VWSIDRPPGNTAKTGRLSVCKSVDAVGGVLGVLAPDEPRTLFNVPARIRGIEPEVTLEMDGRWCGRRDAADKDGRNDRGIVRTRISLTCTSLNDDSVAGVYVAVCPPMAGMFETLVSVVVVLL
jgi:hypothetical protein